MVFRARFLGFVADETSSSTSFNERWGEGGTDLLTTRTVWKEQIFGEHEGRRRCRAADESEMGRSKCEGTCCCCFLLVNCILISRALLVSGLHYWLVGAYTGRGEEGPKALRALFIIYIVPAPREVYRLRF